MFQQFDVKECPHRFLELVRILKKWISPMSHEVFLEQTTKGNSSSYLPPNLNYFSSIRRKLDAVSTVQCFPHDCSTLLNFLHPLWISYCIFCCCSFSHLSSVETNAQVALGFRGNKHDDRELKPGVSSELRRSLFALLPAKSCRSRQRWVLVEVLTRKFCLCFCAARS